MQLQQVLWTSICDTVQIPNCSFTKSIWYFEPKLFVRPDDSSFCTAWWQLVLYALMTARFVRPDDSSFCTAWWQLVLYGLMTAHFKHRNAKLLLKSKSCSTRICWFAHDGREKCIKRLSRRHGRKRLLPGANGWSYLLGTMTGREEANWIRLTQTADHWRYLATSVT
jgi:hypothetical protein